MATLNIGGQRVKVDDAFLSMSPEQQSAAVEEIAKSISTTQPAGVTDRSLSDETAARQKEFFTPRVAAAPNNIMTSTAATLNGIVNGIPIVGPAAQNISDAVMGTGAQLTGGDYGQTVRGLQRRREELAAGAPIASTAGNIVGAVGSVAGLSLPAAGAEALGVTSSATAPLANLLGRTGNSFLSTLGLGTADSLVRGRTGMDAINENLDSASIAGIIPGLGEAAKAGGRAVYNGAIRPIQTAFNRENEVAKRIGGAIQQDVAQGARLGSAEEAAVKSVGAPVLNADRFGTAVRTLARTAANVSPEAAGILKRTTEERFAGQAPRAVGFVQNLMNGATDDLALQEALTVGAKKANGPAYKAAYSSPQARAIWTPEIRNLMQAGPFKAAINAAEETSTNAAAVSGGKAVRNPFVFRPDGTATLRQMPDGSRALPNLEFWDIVQRNLRRQSDQAFKSGDNLLGGQIKSMRDQLLNTLDGTVPEFKAARSGAASFFGADDALEAGKKAVTSTLPDNEIAAAAAKFKPAEKDAAAVGYASGLIARIDKAQYRANVIERVFGSTSKRNRVEVFLGPQKARELEAFVRGEQALHMLKDAVTGNSTTAQQLIAAGVIGGAGGYWQSGGNWQGAMSGATLAALGSRAAAVLGKRVDAQVMKQIADALASQDPKAVQRAIMNASMSQQHIDALAAITKGLELAARGTATGASSAQRQPVEVRIQGGV